MITRRAALKGAALIASSPFIINTASAKNPLSAKKMTAPKEEVVDTSSGKVVDLSKLPRIKHKLVAPPNVHKHDQVAKTGPRVVEFEMKIIEKKLKSMMMFTCKQ